MQVRWNEHFVYSIESVMDQILFNFSLIHAIFVSR